ncbi:MAG: helix-turn-helix domain-containing protein [Acidobacteriota bacterium]|nr:MAG: helix-turn-helix domain-containing protein [Acidobacteriota bacterium]
MPDVIKDEVRRIARREINAAVKQLKKDNARLKRSSADLKRRVAQLEKISARYKATLARVGKQSLQADEKALRKFRFRKDTVATLRKRLGVTQAELAVLVGVHKQAVYNWEHGTTPKGTQKAKLLGLRRLGARQVREILEGMK